MVVFKRKQIVVLSLILMIVVAGYLQYSYNKSSMSASEKDSGKLGEAVYVDSQIDTEAAKIDEDTNKDKDKGQSKDSNKELDKDKGSSKDSGKDASKVKAAEASKMTNDYFAQAKIDREMTRSKDKDSLKELSKDMNIDKSLRADAYEKMMKLANNSEKEMKVEMLIKQKGYSDVIALLGDDGSIDIVVKTPSLTASEISQIADIASRQAKIEIGDVHIKNMF